MYVTHQTHVYPIHKNVCYHLPGMENTAHIVERKGEIFNSVLGLVDVVKGTNSYYKIQALESDKGGA